MTTRQHRVDGKYQRPGKVPSLATLDYMSALVQGESRVCQVRSQEHFRKKNGRSVKKGDIFFTK